MSQLNNKFRTNVIKQFTLPVTSCLVPGRGAIWSSRRGTCVISGYSREVEENCALLSYYTANICNLLPTFRDNLRSDGLMNSFHQFSHNRILVFSIFLLHSTVLDHFMNVLQFSTFTWVPFYFAFPFYNSVVNWSLVSYTYLGACPELQKVTISFVMSVS